MTIELPGDEPVISTKERIGSYDALETLKPGEPFFLLQGGDPLSIAPILLWAHDARTAARREEDDAKAKKLGKKANAAEEVAWAFQAYQRGEAADSQKDIERKGDQFADDRHVQLARACDRISNAIGEGTAIADYLESLCGDMSVPAEDQGKFAMAAACLRENIEGLREVAAEIEPRRVMQRRTA